jgi:glycosyltransferase involved in cell wall biosynthesis
MIEGIPRVSVKIITYNQEDVISRALESLISQRDYIYEICVSDDCSTDKTWYILQKYSEQYPGLFKLNRNDPNIMMFENLEKVSKMVSGDIIYTMAGDDECGKDWFRIVLEFIRVNNIDYKNDCFCILGNSQNIYPNGDSFTVKKNKNIHVNIPPIRLYERGLLSGRSATYSIKVSKKYEKVSQGRSYIAENAQDCQLYLNVDKFYYINKIGNIYYSGIGVSSNMSDEMRSQHEQTMVYAFEFLKKREAPLTRSDMYLPLLNIAKKHMIWYPSIKNYLKMQFYYVMAFDIRLLLKSIDVRAKMFSIIRRLPHKKPICW